MAPSDKLLKVSIWFRVSMRTVFKRVRLIGASHLLGVHYARRANCEIQRRHECEAMTAVA